MKTAIGYTRVSTVDQATEGASLDAQKARIREWAEANGYRLVAIHSDAGLSGKRADNRPGLQKALNTACRTRGAALVAYSLSRLARSTRDAIAIADRLTKARADLVSLSESIDTTTAAGKMVFRMLAVLAEFERDLVSDRTTAAMQHKRRKGERVSRFAPYGHDFTADDRLVENVAEQTVIADIRDMRARQVPIARIARGLSERKIPTKNGAACWSRQMVYRILDRSSD